MPSDARILIVDDHQDTLYALENALAPLGHDFARATSSDEALKHVLRGNVGLLLLDLRRPGAGGLDVVRHMRRVEQTHDIPVVLVTGFGPDTALTSAAFALGVADLVMKPVDPWVLRTKVRHLYDIHQRHRALEQEVRELRALVAGRRHPTASPEAPARQGPPEPLESPDHPTSFEGLRPGPAGPESPAAPADHPRAPLTAPGAPTGPANGTPPPPCTASTRRP